MKPLHNTLEQEVNKLWRRYQKKNQEKFWKKYEGLISQNKVEQTRLVQQPNPTHTLSNIAPEVFKPSVGNYLVIVFVTLLAIILFAHSYVSITQKYGINGESTSLIIIVFILCVSVTTYFTWKFNTFCIEQDSLQVRKNIFAIKYTFAWSDIKYLSIEKRESEDILYRVLIINQYNKKRRKFRFLMSRDDQHTFIHRMIGKNIPIKDNSGYEGF